MDKTIYEMIALIAIGAITLTLIALIIVASVVIDEWDKQASEIE